MSNRSAFCILFCNGYKVRWTFLSGSWWPWTCRHPAAQYPSIWNVKVAGWKVDVQTSSASSWMWILCRYSDSCSCLLSEYSSQQGRFLPFKGGETSPLNCVILKAVNVWAILVCECPHRCVNNCQNQFFFLQDVTNLNWLLKFLMTLIFLSLFPPPPSC